MIFFVIDIVSWYNFFSILDKKTRRQFNMAKILAKIELAPAVKEYIIDTPLIAKKCQPGQFVMIRTHELSERIPLTIADFNRKQGTITLVVQEVGHTTKELGEKFQVGDEILDVLEQVKEEIDKEKPKKSRLQNCLKLIAPMITIANGIPVLATNLQKLHDIIIQCIMNL